MKKSWYLTVFVMLCFVSLSFSMGGGGGGASQKTHRGFQGVIKDQDGNPLKGVEITLISVDPDEVEKAKATTNSEEKKPLTTASGKNGRYRFIAVRHGHYRVRISMDGYQTLEKLIEFKRGSKDAVLNIELKKLLQPTAAASGR